VIVVASAGNDANAALVYPASFDGVVSVSAVDMNKALAPYSNFGSKVDVSAPGGNMAQDQNGDGYPDGVLSTGGDASKSTSPCSPVTCNYVFLQGTSMAAPHVSGVIALMKSVHSSMSPSDFDSLLASGAITEDLGASGRDDRYGYGLIDANRAVVQAQALAGGGVVPLNPILSVTPSSLNFGTAATSGSIVVKNSGNGTLVISSVTQTSSGWLSVNASSVDANGVGTYSVTIDRTGLQENIYTANITVASNGGTINVPVIMQVSTSISNENAGVQYVFLRDAATGSTIDLKTIKPSSGQYVYSFTGVAAGSYNIISGSDLDNDNNVCDAGESCGAYPILDFSNLSTLNVSSDMTLDFSTGFSGVVVNANSVKNTSNNKTISQPGLKRLAQ
jgi:serine protease